MHICMPSGINFN